MPARTDKDSRGFVLLTEFVGLGIRTHQSPPLTQEEVEVVKAFLERLMKDAAPEHPTGTLESGSKPGGAAG